MEDLVINGVTYTAKEPASNLVLVRTYSAGVHFGELVSRNGKELVLKNAGRLWRWRGANSLSGVAQNGVLTNEYTRIDVLVDEITLTEAIEVVKVTEKAAKTLVPVWNQ